MNAYHRNGKSDSPCWIKLSLTFVLALAALLARTPTAIAQDCCESPLILWPGQSCTLQADCEVTYAVIFGGASLDTSHHRLTITASGGLVLFEGGLLTIPRGGTVVLTGGGTSLVNGLIRLVDGRVRDDSTFQIATTDHALIGDGSVDGEHSSAFVIIGERLTLTSEITLEGLLQIVPAKQATGTTFINNGAVDANNSGTLELNVHNLDDGSNNVTGTWRVGTSSSAVLKVQVGSTLLTGGVTVADGTLDIDENLCTAGDLTFTGGRIDVAPGKSFTAGGACS